MLSPGKLVDYTRKRAPDNRIITPRSPNWREIQGSEFGLDFDTSYIQVPHSPSLNISGDISILAGINPTTYGTHPNGFGRIVDKNGLTGWSFILNKDDPLGGTNGLWFRTLNKWLVSDNDVISLNTKQDVAVTFNGTSFEASFFVDGEPAGQETGTIGIGQNVVDLLIGRRVLSAIYFEGIIFYVLIYNRVLSIDEIRQFAGNHNIVPDMRDLISWWRFQEGYDVANGRPIRDWSGNNNHGSMQGDFPTDSWKYTGVQ